jgi:hypothetical protein
MGRYYKRNNPVDIKSADLYHAGTNVKILRIAFIDNRGLIIKKLHYSQPFRVRVEVQVINPIKNCRFGISIDTNNGVRIATIYNTDNGDRLRDLRRGKINFEVEISDNIFAPGEYKLGVDIMKASIDPLAAGENIESITPIIPFEITDLDGGKRYSRFALGTVTIKGRWIISD